MEGFPDTTISFAGEARVRVAGDVEVVEIPPINIVAEGERATIRVMVTGGRFYGDVGHATYNLERGVLAAVLDHVITITSTHYAATQQPIIPVLINGGAPGADTRAAQHWAKRELPYVTVPARWNQHGRAAGPLRNAEMVSGGMFGADPMFVPDLCVAFPGGRGTHDTKTRCKEAGIPILEVVL